MSKKLSAVALAREVVKQTPYEIMRSSASDRELRAEYTRMRDQAQKQMKRLLSSSYQVPERYAEEARRGFLKLSEIRDRRELSYAMSNLSEFLTQKTTSVSGRRKLERETLETLHRHGYEGITKKNVGAFGKFMEAMRQRMGGRKHYPSGDLAQFFSDELSHFSTQPVVNDELMGAFNAWEATNLS